MSAASCPALDSAVSARFQQLLQQYQARDREYDARTQQGKTQGAWLQ
jgi:hypothetical protein